MHACINPMCASILNFFWSFVNCSKRTLLTQGWIGSNSRLAWFPYLSNITPREKGEGVVLKNSLPKIRLFDWFKINILAVFTSCGRIYLNKKFNKKNRVWLSRLLPSLVLLLIRLIFSSSRVCKISKVLKGTGNEDSTHLFAPQCACIA